LKEEGNRENIEPFKEDGNKEYCILSLFLKKKEKEYIEPFKEEGNREYI